MSIKKKFATAVATASLLAGLFGSAFVPSALAARETPLDTPSVANTLNYESDNDYMMPVIGTDGEQNGKERAFYVSLVEYNHYIDFDGGYFDSDYIYEVDTAPSDDFYLEYRLNTKNGADVETVDLKATSSSSLIRVAWSFDDDGDYDNCEDLDDTDESASAGDDRTSFGTTDTVTEVSDGDGIYYLCFYSNGKPGTATISVVANGVTLAPVTITTLGDIASLTVSAASSNVAEDNLSVDDFFTVTAKDAAGTVINGPWTGVGGGIYLDPDAEFGSGTYDGVIYAEGNPSNQQGDDIDFIDEFSQGTPGVTAAGVEFETYNLYDLNASACVSETAAGENDGDAGKSYSLSIQIENDDEDIITSNSFTMLCTGGLDGARITNVTPEKTSGAREYEETGALDDGVLMLEATVVDADGRKLGEGAGNVATAFGLPTFAPTAYDAELFYSTTGDTDVIDGVWQFAYLEPDTSRAGTFSYSITWDDANNATAGDQELKKSLAYEAGFTGYDGEISKTRNAAKTVATVVADFGEAGQYGKILFVIQNANGAERQITLNAGSDGAATLVFARRNQRVTVTAYLAVAGSSMYDDGETSTINVRFR